jgi:hypothetical protein
MNRPAPDFIKINAAALPAVCARWMPHGERVGREFLARCSIFAVENSRLQNGDTRELALYR